MKLQIVSDIHVDSNGFDAVRQRLVNDKKADVLVIAGDIANGYANGAEGFGQPLDKFVKIRQDVIKLEKMMDMSWGHKVVCHGNHDMYYGQLPGTVFGNEQEIDGVVFITSPLFSYLAKSQVNDERHMRLKDRFLDLKLITDENGSPIDPSAYADYHEKCVAFLRKALKKLPDGKAAVVVTHHLPLIECINPKYASDASNHFYASDLHYLLDEYGDRIEVWIHGHSHEPMQQRIGGVMFVRNPVGYFEYGEGSQYSTMTLEVTGRRQRRRAQVTLKHGGTDEQPNGSVGGRGSPKGVERAICGDSGRRRKDAAKRLEDNGYSRNGKGMLDCYDLAWETFGGRSKAPAQVDGGKPQRVAVRKLLPVRDGKKTPCVDLA